MIAGNSATTRGGGVLVISGSVSSTSSTFSNNSGIGIDLFVGSETGNFVTANDLGDGDTGANNLQNFPVLSISGSNVTRTLNSTANTQFRIELFSNTTPDPSGFGEGQTFIGFQDVTTDGTGIASFTFTSPAGSNFSSTATNILAGQTSEFSVIAVSPPTLSIAIAKTTDGAETGATSSVFTLTRTGDTTASLNVIELTH
jgi:trimeric autotransporter adhesin